MKNFVSYCVLFSILIANDISSQSFYIKNYQYKETYNTVFNGLINQSDTLVVSGLSYDCLDSLTCFQGFYVSKIDTFGQIINETVILAEGDDIVAENTPILCPTTDNGYFLVGELLSRNNGFLVKLKRNLEVEFSKEYIENTEEILSVRNRGIVQLQGYYYILSIKQHSNFQRIAHLIKIDSLGQLIWDRPFVKEGDASVLFKLSNGGNLMIFGQRSKLNNENKVDIKQWCFFVDTAGLVIDEHESDWMVNGLSGYFDVVELEDGYLISTSNYFYDPQVGVYPKNQIVLQKTNEEFIAEWSVTYGDITTINSIKNIIPLEHGMYLGTGNYAPHPDNQQNSALTTLTIKFNESGEILWDRLDSILYEPIYGCKNSTAESIILNTGSILTTGYIERYLPGQGSLGYLMKLDKNGCINPGCHPILNTGQIGGLGDDIELYPNPVYDELHIKFIDPNFSLQSCRISIVNDLGVNLITSRNSFINGSITLNLEVLPTGIYFIHVLIDNKIISKKIIKF